MVVVCPAVGVIFVSSLQFIREIWWMEAWLKSICLYSYFWILGARDFWYPAVNQATSSDLKLPFPIEHASTKWQFVNAMPVYYRMIGYISRVQVKEVGHIRSPLQSDHNCLQTTVHRPEGISTFLPYISPWETAKQNRKPQVCHRLWGLLAGRNSSYPQDSENSFLRGMLVEWLPSSKLTWQ